MNLLVCLEDDPVQNIPVWAGLTDAARALPGLRVVLAGSAPAVDLIRRHPAVNEVLILPAVLDARPYSFAAWRAARRVRGGMLTSREIPSLLIDPFGRADGRRLARVLDVRSIGVAASARRDRDYSSVYPLPDALHPVQALRVLFAAALGYSLHDLAPDFGLPLAAPLNDEHHADGLVVDLLVDWQGMHWIESEQAALRVYLADSGLRVAYLPIDADAASARSESLSLLDSARYLLTGISPLAWYAAAIGKPGLCLCAAGTAKTTGVISTRFARQKMLNIDDPALTRPQVVAESIIQVLSRRGTALV